MPVWEKSTRCLWSKAILIYWTRSLKDWHQKRKERGKLYATNSISLTRRKSTPTRWLFSFNFRETIKSDVVWSRKWTIWPIGRHLRFSKECKWSFSWGHMQDFQTQRQDWQLITGLVEWTISIQYTFLLYYDLLANQWTKPSLLQGRADVRRMKPTLTRDFWTQNLQSKLLYEH